MSVQDLALQRNKYKHLSDEEWRWFLQQVEGRERTADKLPTFASIDDWWYPVRLSCEQCSSELTARYKASLYQRSGLSAKRSMLYQSEGRSLLDLTGGYGVDTYFLSEGFSHTDYVEQNAELCRIAEHNFQRPTPTLPKGKEITVHNCTAEEFLSSPLSPPLQGEAGRGGYSLIFLDPARRDSHGGKVFKLADCTPNVVELLPDLLSHLVPGGSIMIKLSPMIDLTQAIKELSAVSIQHSAISWDAHIVAVRNEVKEVLLVSGQQSVISGQRITAIDLTKPEQVFVFTREEELNCKAINSEALNVRSTINSAALYLYEPNAAILKAGAYKLAGARFGLHKLDTNTHLYTSDTLVENFPGRIFKALPFREGFGVGSQANVLVRNYPLTAEQLKKKLHLRDGGTAYVIGCRVAGKPTVFAAERIS